MNNDKLDKIEQELIKQMNEEEAVEELIEHASEEIATKLAKHPIHVSEINGTRYMFEYICYKQDGKDILCIVVSNYTQRMISPQKYGKTRLEVEYDRNITELDNLKGMVESFIRYKTGNIKPEEM